jgi:hypothetical protein
MSSNPTVEPTGAAALFRRPMAPNRPKLLEVAYAVGSN